ncbi:MAG: hypothetical protein JST19_22355 [Bacteroidetes bacterium]|nr:hypothetical protein [Bacteroidota bacterium]
MKALTDLINVEKARLLYDLFPQEIPAFVEFTKGFCRTVQEEQERYRSDWPQNHMFTFDFWLSLAVQMEQIIEKYGSRLHKSGKLFSDQLFGGWDYSFLFTIHCLTVYVTAREHDNQKFSLAVNLLFT